MLRAVILGAGFGGLELATTLSEAGGGDIDVALIDQNDAFVFGYSKLDLMFGHATPDSIRLPYADIVKPGVRFLQETITSIDPEARRVTTNAGTYEADVLIVALGADYDLDATPGLTDAGNEFYSVAGGALGGSAAGFHAWPRDHRRLRRALQVPAGAERGGLAAARLPVSAGRPRCV
jgi:sulfide:quinone oxidoreductase